MSGIAKPHFTFTNAVAPNNLTVVNADNVQSMEVLDIKASPLNNNKAEYYILITMNPVNSVTKIIKIQFATAAARNTSIANARTLIATAVA